MITLSLQHVLHRVLLDTGIGFVAIAVFMVCWLAWFWRSEAVGRKRWRQR